MELIKEALTFDDVLPVPRYSSVLPSETNLNVNLGHNLILKTPFLSSAMDTVTESYMATTIAQKGGLGIIHRNLSVREQVKEIKKVKNKKQIVGAAIGTSDESTSGTGIGVDVTGLEESTLWVKYAFGPVTVGYQTSEADGPTTTQDDDSTAMSISYAISDDLSVSYGSHELDLGSATATGTDQESTGISASYTMGGMSISGHMHETDNVAGIATADLKSYELELSFAF